MKNYHFWYSAKQADTLSNPFDSKSCPMNYANISDEVVLYTTCSSTPETIVRFDDLVYLGQGDYTYSRGTW